MNLFSEHEIVLRVVTQDMREWLEQTCPKRHYITQNMIRWKCAGPNVPMSQQMRPEGWKIVFEDEKELLLFKVAWG